MLKFLKKLKIQLPYELGILLLGIYPKEEKKTENANLKRPMHPNVHGNLIFNGQDMETPKCPSTDEWINKM